MLYCAESASLAVVEALAHLPNPYPPLEHELVTIDIPDTAPIEALTQSEWIRMPTNLNGASNSATRLQLSIEITQRIGDTFANTGSHLALKVPSVIVPQNNNYLINPKHPLAEQLQILSIVPFSFDARLFHF